MFGGVSSLKERFGDPCKSFRNTGKLSLSTAKQDKWYGGFVYSSEMVCLSLSLLRHASAFQKVCSSAKYGYQYISGLDMRHSQTFSNWVKPTFDKSSGTRSLCTGHCKKRMFFGYKQQYFPLKRKLIIVSTLEVKLLSLFFFPSFAFVIDVDCKISRATFSVDVYIDYTLTIFILKTSYINFKTTSFVKLLS